MERRRIFSIFSLVFILLGVSGINITGAATVKYTVPGAPTMISATGGLQSAVVRWKTPTKNGGKPITSYKVTYYPGAKTQVCKSSATNCTVKIANPNKPSSKPAPVRFYFTVAAVNSIGTGPSSGKSAYVSVRFRATIYIPPKYGTPTPTPSPTPDSSPTAAPIACGQGNIPLITTYDGTYRGTATVTTTLNNTPPVTSTSQIATTFTILNGRGTGTADIWDVNGCVTDASGGGTVVVTDKLIGAITFAIKISLDSATNTMSGTGKGINTFSTPAIGSLTVEFVLNVTRGANQ